MRAIGSGGPARTGRRSRRRRAAGTARRPSPMPATGGCRTGRTRRGRGWRGTTGTRLPRPAGRRPSPPRPARTARPSRLPLAPGPRGQGRGLPSGRPPRARTARPTAARTSWRGERAAASPASGASCGRIVDRKRTCVVQEMTPRTVMDVTLPAGDYYRPDVFELERARIFERRWFCVGREEEIAKGGDRIVREVAGESLLIVRDESGRPGAFYNVCRHRGTRLCDGEGAAGQGAAGRESTGRAIVCPYHSWTYALDGRLIATPNVPDMAGF